MKKIGILGGTFDPIHNGHLMLGEQAYHEYHLDEIWFMPSGQPPHKKGRHVTPGEMRLEMVRLAVADTPYFVCSDFEQRREGNTYTALTLELLMEQYPNYVFYFIIGADSLYEIENWYHPRQVMEKAVLMVADREYSDQELTLDQQIAFLKETYGARIEKLHCPVVDISSTDIREMAARGEDISSIVPEKVADYIVKHKLYQQENLNNQ